MRTDAHVGIRAPQQQRARVTRDAIVESAAAEFSRRGFGGASVNAILGASGRTKGAMYFHFQSKHDLAVAVVDAAARRYSAIAEPWRTAPEDPVTALAGLIGEVTAAIVDERVLRAELRLGIDPDFPFDATRASQGWEAVALELVVSAERAGCFTAPFGPIRFVAAMASMLAGCGVMADITDDPIALRGRFDEATDAVVAAMTTSDAAARYRSRAFRDASIE
ncbi:TetR family transcriptional regulator [Rhodococcus sp. NPDC057297]|uniref:TetR family transcriptional regulator n=1 Tax=Rhodococcus sp. NPDC057297 TaxID=3346090 RepID=UPI003628E1B6